MSLGVIIFMSLECDHLSCSIFMSLATSFSCVWNVIIFVVPCQSLFKGPFSVHSGACSSSCIWKCLTINNNNKQWKIFNQDLQCFCRTGKGWKYSSRAFSFPQNALSWDTGSLWTFLKAGVKFKAQRKHEMWPIWQQKVRHCLSNLFSLIGIIALFLDKFWRKKCEKCNLRFKNTYW